MIQDDPRLAWLSSARGATTSLCHGDCTSLLKHIPDQSVDLTVSSPPYCIGKSYEDCRSVEDFVRIQENVLPEIARVTKMGGHICWQVGYHVDSNAAFPLDYTVFNILSKIPGLILRNRIIWTFGHGSHSQARFSGRHEVVLWFSKGETYDFDLDAIRVPQKYPGKRHYKGPRKGEWSGNPKGKNPGDVWEIPNVKSNHVEKTSHPCQFPVALVTRLTRALTKRKQLVFDPFMGAGTTGVAAILEGRRFLGAEMERDYVLIAEDRVAAAGRGTAQFRPLEQPLYDPRGSGAVAAVPPHFWT